MANEDDVVLAFRQAVEEEIEHAQKSGAHNESAFSEHFSTEENLRRLAVRHEALEHEVRLMRTIILKLISQPVDEQG